MGDVVQKEISFPIIPESLDEEVRDYLLRMQEIIREVSLGATYLSALTLQEFSADGSGFLDEDDMASDSAIAVSSQQAIAAFIASSVAGTGYVDRGSVSVSDFDEGDTPTEEAWTDLDLGPDGLSIIPVGAKAVSLKLRIKDASVSQYLLVRKNGSTSEAPGNILTVQTQVANIANFNNGTIACDNGVVEYFLKAGTDEFDITVTGWFL